MLWYSNAIYFSLFDPSTSDLINRTKAWTYQVTFTFSYLYFSLFDPSTSDLINRTTAWTYQVTFTFSYLYFSLSDPSTRDLINRTTAWTYQLSYLKPTYRRLTYIYSQSSGDTDGHWRMHTKCSIMLFLLFVIIMNNSTIIFYSLMQTRGTPV